MECTGKITGASQDWQSGKIQLHIEVNERIGEELNDIIKCDKLSIKMIKHREKRSIDANGLLWHCIGEIAGALRTDKWEVYLTMLKRYGRYTHIVVKENAVEAMKNQWRECEIVGDITVNGQKAVQMLCYFGSSTYNTQEFSRLLDGVISEMKEMGLQPPLSEDMKAALERWDRQWRNL